MGGGGAPAVGGGRATPAARGGGATRAAGRGGSTPAAGEGEGTLADGVGAGAAGEGSRTPTGGGKGGTSNGRRAATAAAACRPPVHGEGLDQEKKKTRASKIYKQGKTRVRFCPRCKVMHKAILCGGLHHCRCRRRSRPRITLPPAEVKTDQPPSSPRPPPSPIKTHGRRASYRPRPVNK